VTALWRIRPDPRWPAAAIDVLGSATEPIERQEAAEALYDVRDPAAVQALVEALDDPEPLVATMLRADCSRSMVYQPNPRTRSTCSTG
jgi:HEAT repeat protein